MRVFRDYGAGKGEGGGRGWKGVQEKGGRVLWVPAALPAHQLIFSHG